MAYEFMRKKCRRWLHVSRFTAGDRGFVLIYGSGHLVTDDMIFKKYIFSQKMAKKLAFSTQNKAKLCQILIITMVFEKNDIFSAENCRKFDHNIVPWRPRCSLSARNNRKNALQRNSANGSCG
jgi:hypothetical protein